MGSRDKRRAAIRGGLLAGVGLGALLTWLLDIYQIAHPIMPSVLGPGYPNMALTAIVLLVFSGGFGTGLGLVASTLIRDEDLGQAGAVTDADPSPRRTAKETYNPG